MNNFRQTGRVYVKCTQKADQKHHEALKNLNLKKTHFNIICFNYKLEKKD